ncbi:lipopolysaccharide kinase InaA family protein [Holophaga foetida]|uniref:lipopolysaccharide kinase InaA family protein n=1 Tax=Holophaga foetida TaxID=35839 RepID=UPI0002474D5F|nr:lipopolysaccharide kinase InaA family protein [Holophaga foetida]
MSQAPPLPQQWPFAPRAPLAPVALREGVSLPSLGCSWNLEAAAGLQLPEAASEIPSAFGRGGVIRAGDLVLRPYRRGGLVRFINRRTYPDPVRFRQELEVHRALWEAGFPTVEPLGIAHRRRGWGVEGVLLTRYAEATPWPKCWESPGVLPALGAAIDALVEWHLWSPDLNATNVMVGDQGILLLDWDKARWTDAPDLRERYRERLARSLRKLGAPEEIQQDFMQ